MKDFLSRSFRNRLFAAFLVVSLVPLLICSALLLQTFRLRLTNDVNAEAREHLDTVSRVMDALYDDFARAAALAENPLIAAALAGDGAEGTQVYNVLFDATEGLRGYARFDLYDAGGRWRYSTQTAPEDTLLPTSWGVLYSASPSGGFLTFVAAEDVTVTQSPLLQGAVLIAGRDGETAGYLLISMYQNGFRQLLDGKYGAQNDLILLNRYWRPVYCAQPSLAASLAPRLRLQLLDGQPLNGASEDFLYSVAYHPPTGLYIILQKPQVFTRGTMNILYAVSLSSALICILFSILMSLQLSRQMFYPIKKLHRAIGEVANNNLDAYVPHNRKDELGQLADRFNGMMVALKHNQEQLVENQQELNAAQIRMLQAQLNPHFLCNTLDTMKWISKINKVPQVALMSTNLADILRFCISPDEFVPLYREVEILQRYMEIQNIRLSDAFAFQLILPIELESCLVPKMILQPIVENAILHGLEGVGNGGVKVEASQPQPGLLQITIADNGRGLPAEMVGRYGDRNRDSCRGHLGLYNIDTILRKHYGAGFGLYLSNRKDGPGAVVTATLPMRVEEDALC